MSRSRQFISILALPCALLAGPVQAGMARHALSNGTVEAVVTEAIGGRLLSFSLKGKPNFLKVDEAAGDPDAPVTAQSPNVGYLGHEIWVGPQKQWWTHQSVNPELAAAQAPWPPDPYLSLARYTIARRSDDEIVLGSGASPVNGLQLSKRYALVKGKPNSLQLDVTATNRRETDVAWDIWFNTRTPAHTQVYVPVASSGDVRLQSAAGQPGVEGLSYTLSERVFSLDMPSAPGAAARVGKVFLQPAAGWMAGFHSGQAFIVQFPLQPRAAIHPDQGQIELYNDIHPDAPQAGLLEMEVHAPYLTLRPGQRMQARETWTLLPYDGPATRAAHLAFLRRHARALKLQGL
ncbi:MAG: DUF4380 domain-containing protein [Gammaproteobacteria bacterium]